MQHSDVALLRKNMNDPQYKIAIIDEHPVFREGLAVALGRYPEFEVVADAGTAETAYEVFRSHQIDVATIDILMPGTSGMTLTSDLHELQPQARVLGLSVIDEPGLIADMLRAHASGYALKTQSTAEIVDALHNILHGVRYLPPSVARALVCSPPTTPAPSATASATPGGSAVTSMSGVAAAMRSWPGAS